MFGIFSRARRRSQSVSPRRARLTIEALETRWCPAAPQLLSLACSAQPGHMVLLQGSISDEHPQTVTVQFSGIASGSVNADLSGHFSLLTTASTLGTVRAIGVDDEGLWSGAVESNLAVSPPTMTLSALPGPNGTVTLQGRVTAATPGGRIVTFSGAANGFAVTADDGSFSATLLGSGLGDVSGETTDDWGQSSELLTVPVMSAPPEISGFFATEQEGNYWIFKGTVTDMDENPAGLVVRLGGVPSLAGKTATVGDDGTFCAVYQLAPGEHGTATAQTTDRQGLDSNEAMTMIDPTP